MDATLQASLPGLCGKLSCDTDNDLFPGQTPRSSPGEDRHQQLVFCSVMFVKITFLQKCRPRSLLLFPLPESAAALNTRMETCGKCCITRMQSFDPWAWFTMCHPGEEGAQGSRHRLLCLLSRQKLGILYRNGKAVLLNVFLLKTVTTCGMQFDLSSLFWR